MKMNYLIAVILLGFSLSAFKEKELKMPKTEIMPLKHYLQDTTHLESLIIQTLPSGPNTILILNRGSSHQVNVGDSGIIAGQSDLKFRIMEVLPVRSRAVFIPEVQVARIKSQKAIIYIKKTK